MVYEAAELLLIGSMRREEDRERDGPTDGTVDRDVPQHWVVPRRYHSDITHPRLARSDTGTEC